MRSLFGKRVLVVIALLVVVGVAMAAYNYFYTWTKYYRIRPLTSIEKIKFQASGGTIGIVVNYTDAETGASATAVLPLMVVPYSVPPGIEITSVPPGIEITSLFAPLFPEPKEQYGVIIFTEIPIPESITSVEGLSNEEFNVLSVFGQAIGEIAKAYNGIGIAVKSPRPPPVYHETLWLEKKSYVNFMVLTDDLTKLREHFAWLIEIEYIFHPGLDGKLGTKDDYLYAIVPIPLVNPWQQGGSGFARILLGGGEYGVIKTTCYWTKAVTQEVSHSFTIHIWAQEYETTRPPS